MDRPVLDPMFHTPDESAGAKVTGAHPRSRVRAAIGLVMRVLRFLVRVLIINPVARSFRGRGPMLEEGGFWRRFCKGFLYRASFAPIMIALLAVAMVFVGTHPPRVQGVVNPSSEGIHFETVFFPSSDGTPIEAWLVPAIDARKVLIDKEKAVKRRYPAVVLLHDFGKSPQQFMPIIRPLHEEGYVVMVLSMRGTGNGPFMGQTFGLNESNDALAAVHTLRQRAFVQADKVAIIGIGTGATAALLAAKRDNSIAALVVQDPVSAADQTISRHICPQQSWMSWIRPLCKWTFEMAYQVDIDDINLADFEKLIAQRPVLKFSSENGEMLCLRKPSIEKIEDFLAEKFASGKATVASVNEK